MVPLPGDGAVDAGVARVVRPEAPALTFEPARPEEAPVCPTCSTRNPVGNRFCVSCGSRLAATSAASVLPSGTSVLPAGSMQASPALQLAPPIATPAPARIVCSRCNGASDATMLYCQFCGASLRPEVTRPRVSAPPPVSQTGADAAFATGSPEVSGRLVTIARDGAEGASYPLSGEQIDVGREDGNILLREDSYVSPRHLRLLRRDDAWYARDLGSLNGIYLRLRKPHALTDGDLLLIGLQVLRFESVKDAEQGYGPATHQGTLLFGSPMLPRYGRLCERTVEGVTRNVFYLHRDETIIGRESGDIVFTDDPFMSRRHVAIRLDGATATFTMTDLGSSNGTYMAVRGDVPLAHGDFLRVGQHLFRVDLVASRPPPPGGSPVGGVRRPS